MKSFKTKEKKSVTFIVNGETQELEVGQKSHQITPSETLAQTLRDRLELTGTKVGCDQGACGSCTVIIDEKPVLSCMTLTIECHGCKVTTIEGLADQQTGELHPVQKSFVDHSAFQCGFCTPGIIMASKTLLDNHPHPDEHTIKEALSGHYCRCISHYQVMDAVSDAADGRKAKS